MSSEAKGGAKQKWRDMIHKYVDRKEVDGFLHNSMHHSIEALSYTSSLSY
jgi:hypothetical protein